MERMMRGWCRMVDGHARDVKETEEKLCVDKGEARRNKAMLTALDRGVMMMNRAS